MSTTKQQIRAALQITMAVAESIREAREIPSGSLYAILCAKVSFGDYQAIIRTLKNAKLVEETPAHLLRWIGPAIGEARA
jgi:hypothetical protein